MKKYSIKCIAVVLAICVSMPFFAGCQTGGAITPALPASTATAPPSDEPLEWTFEATLWFPAVNKLSLLRETRLLTMSGNESQAYAAVQAMSEGPVNTSLALSVVHTSLTLSRVDISDNVCHVHFSGQLPADQENLLVLRAALANTIKDNQDIDYVDVYINGMQPGYGGRPLGVLSPIEVTLETYLANITQELSGEQEDVSLSETRAAQLFLPDHEGAFLRSEVRSISSIRGENNTNLMRQLLARLFEEPANEEHAALPAFVLKDIRQVPPYNTPETGAGAESQAQIKAVKDGDICIIELDFERPAEEYDERLAYAAIVFTVASFIPNVAGVRIYLDGELVDAQAVLQREEYQQMPEMFRQTDFLNYLGQVVNVSLPDESGEGLVVQERNVDQSVAYDPMVRVEELFEGEPSKGVGWDFISAEDVAACTRRANMVVVDFKAGFFDKLTAFIESGRSVLPEETRARMFIFSLVNTLCDLPGVERVWILENGGRIDKTLQNIYLGNALFYNAGLAIASE